MFRDALKRRSACSHIALGLGVAALVLTAAPAFGAASLNVINSHPSPAEGSWVMQVALDGTGAGRAYVQHGEPGGCAGCPNAESHYNFRFRLRSDDVTNDANKRHRIFQLFRDAVDNRRVITITWRQDGAGDEFLRFKTREDDGSTQNTAGWASIANDDWSIVECDWTQSDGSNNGSLSVFVDGVLFETVSGLDNDTMFGSWARMGVVGGNDLNTSGEQYFDLYESFR